MTYSKEIYAQAHEILDERKRKAETDAEKRKERLYREMPELGDIERRLSSVALMTARTVLAQGDDAKTALDKLAKDSLALQKSQKELMLSHGYPIDYIEPEYTCTFCKDTGVIEKESKTVYCECFLRLLKDCACEELNRLSPLKLSTFSSFKLDYYPYDSDSDGVSPYSRMSKIFNYCKNYAQSFSKESKSILMRGSTGLGKTHLSLAIANEVLKKGFYVVYVSAPSVLQKLERAHFDYDAKEEDRMFETLGDCDLLIIDDLGTEFITQYSKAAIYNIFNNRIMKRKPTIINTNMTVRELQETYTQRFVSRIIGSCDKLDFIGKDIRAMNGI